MNDQAQISEAGDAYQAVMDAIVTQQLAPSQKVSENLLSDMFGISRTVARTLIERLVSQQFMVNLSPRITIVAPLTLHEIKQNFTLRKMLLPSILSLAAATADFERLEALSHEIEALLRPSTDDEALALLKKNKEINIALCESVGFPLMHDWVRQLEDGAMRIYWLYLKRLKSMPYTADQHVMAIEVMRCDEPSRVRAIVHDILSQAEDRIMNTIFSSQQFSAQDLKI
ncbi:GntR family transcriptional regulator [Pseudokordiimonas caeni]|uniref:GntR family transcriptional regulator n=1 Tax=Pseudokordiimonas caeni TaxID=2997908 RepID=UPI002810D44F|nr:GntR family transcriptional regulator [Pseudokordiimonas caeni]